MAASAAYSCSSSDAMNVTRKITRKGMFRVDQKVKFVYKKIKLECTHFNSLERAFPVIYCLKLSRHQADSSRKSNRGYKNPSVLKDGNLKETLANLLSTGSTRRRGAVMHAMSQSHSTESHSSNAMLIQYNRSRQPHPITRRSIVEAANAGTMGPPWAQNTICQALFTCIRYIHSNLFITSGDRREEEAEETLEKHRINPPALAELTAKTGFEKEWLKYMYREFKQRCPSGKMYESDFMTIFRELFPYSVGDSYGRRMFMAFDRSAQEMITYEDMIMVLWELSQHTPESYTEFVMHLMDPDFHGEIDAQQFADFVESVICLYGGRERNKYRLQPEYISQLSTGAFTSLDANTREQSKMRERVTVANLENLYTTKLSDIRLTIIPPNQFCCKNSTSQLISHKTPSMDDSDYRIGDNDSFTANITVSSSEHGESIFV